LAKCRGAFGVRIAPGFLKMMLTGLKNRVWTFVLFAVSVVSSIEASTLRLAWSASTSSDVAEYRVYTGTVPGQYSRTFDVGNVTSFVVPDLVAGTTYYFAVSAINTTELESPLSSSVSAVAPGDGVMLAGSILFSAGEYELRVQGSPSATYIIDQSEDLREWSAVATRQADPNGRVAYRTGATIPKRFFRLRGQ
jgi:hypothetical protein